MTGRTPGGRSSPNSASRMNNMKHGIYASRFLTTDEQEIFEAMVDRFHEEYALNDSADFMQLELICLYFTQLGRAIALEDWQTAERLDAMMRRHLSDLKATKRTREGEATPGAQGMNAADWANQLLQRVKARKDEVDVAECKPGTKKTPETVQRTPAESGEEHA
ncbi:MAG: hypothetical protein ACYDBB_01520 [Armatimonadota bacterium]